VSLVDSEALIRPRAVFDSQHPDCLFGVELLFEIPSGMRNLVLEYINGLTILDAHRARGTISGSDEERLSHLLTDLWAQLTKEQQLQITDYVMNNLVV
jgi:hypothetical protein